MTEDRLYLQAKEKKMFKYPSLSPIYRIIGPNLGHAHLNCVLAIDRQMLKNLGKGYKHVKKIIFVYCKL